MEAVNLSKYDQIAMAEYIKMVYAGVWTVPGSDDGANKIVLESAVDFPTKREAAEFWMKLELILGKSG